MDRREFIMAGASSLALGIASQAFAQQGGTEQQGGTASANTTTSGGGGKATPAALANQDNRRVVDAAAECVKVGEICQEHCAERLRQGDKSMAKCSTSIAEMLPMCRALQALAIQGSQHLAAHAATCAKVCRECEAACKVHASHHEACKNCMESCNRCATACEQLKA
jgi:Cys-rich four helix bundle protein (predicted Tat secretion target)